MGEVARAIAAVSFFSMQGPLMLVGIVGIIPLHE